MSHGHRELPPQDRSATVGRAPRSDIAPGKQTLTSRLPPSSAVHAPAQLARDPAAAASAGADHAALTSAWTPTVMRPDLHPAPVQRKSAAEAGEHARPAPSSGGQPMPAEVQAKMEGAFGTDFSAVRVHEGQQARDVGALAYTQGADIHFASGQYQPGSQSGQELLGHELTHVVQQSQGRVQATTQAKGMGVNDDPGLEREADEMGARAARGQPAAATGSADIGGQSSPEPLAQMRLAGQVIQRMPAWDSLETTDNDVYGVDAGSRAKLYGQSDAAAPMPSGLYSATTEDKDEVTYQVWTPNVKFTSKDEQNTIVGNASGAMDLLNGSPEEREVGGLKMQVVNQYVASLEQTLRQRIDGQDGSATMGVVGPNDCRGWASQLRYMIAMQLGEEGIEEGGEQSNFDLDEDTDVPALSPGDQMTHTFSGGACSYHSATVVATDPPSVVTLEAHASKDLTAPEFHVRAGLPGFVADNDTTPEGESRGLGKKGQLYDVKRSQPTAQAELHKIDALLAEYDGQDPLLLLQIIQKFKTI